MDDAHQGAPDTGRAWTRRPKLNRLVEVRSLRLGSDIVRPRLHDAGQHAAGSAPPHPRLAPRRLLVIPLDSRISSPIALACHGGFPGHGGDHLWQQPQSPSAGDGLGAVGRAELVENVADMFLDGVEHHDKLVGDLPVRSAGG
jgi:hypothetical protein